MSQHREAARYHVTVVPGGPSRTAAEVAADAGAEVIRQMRVEEGVAALAAEEQIDALTAGGATCTGTLSSPRGARSGSPRWARGTGMPRRGDGWPDVEMPYLNVVEVGSALQVVGALP